jgi:hypothetical protein
VSADPSVFLSFFLHVSHAATSSLPISQTAEEAEEIEDEIDEGTEREREIARAIIVIAATLSPLQQ